MKSIFTVLTLGALVTGVGLAGQSPTIKPVATVGQLHDGIGKLAAQAFFRT